MAQVTTSVDEWRSSIQTSAGVQSVMITGILPTVMLSAVSWVSLARLRKDIELTMVKEVVQSCLVMLDAMVRNRTFGIALIVDGINTTVAIPAMQVWNVCARKVTLLMERDVLVCILLCTITLKTVLRLSLHKCHNYNFLISSRFFFG
jgi:hypothetical protein